MESEMHPDERLLQHDEERGYNQLSGRYGASVPIDDSVDVTNVPETKRMFEWSSWILAATAWLSMGIMGSYMIKTYNWPMLSGNIKAWPAELFGYRITTFGVGVHFIGAATLLLQGNVQLLPSVRRKYPAFHRWSGRVYAFMSMVTAMGAFVFIVIHRMAAGILMDIGFGALGIMMVWFTIETVRHARARRFEKHREWALRLYALVIASWLFRIEFGIWLLPFISNNFRFLLPLFTKAIKLFFFIPNLLLVEYVLYVERKKSAIHFQVASSVVFGLVSIFMMYVTYWQWVLPLLGKPSFMNPLPPSAKDRLT